MKAKLFIGPQGSGKSQAAFNEIEDHSKTRKYNGSEVLRGGPFKFEACNQDTDLIIIDDLVLDSNYKCRFILSLVKFGVQVEKPGEWDRFTIKPKIILCSENVPGLLDLLLECEVFQCNYPHQPAQVFPTPNS